MGTREGYRGCAEARRGRGGPPRRCGALRGEERWGDESRERDTGKGRGEVQRPDPGGRHLEGHADQTSPQPPPSSQLEQFAARAWRRAAAGGALTSPREADLSGRGARASGPSRKPRLWQHPGPRAAGQPDRKVRSGACPTLQARPVAGARHWAPGAARLSGTGLAPPRSSGRGRRALQRDRGRGRLGSLPARRHRLGAPAAATGAGLPRDRPESRFA